MDTGFGTNQLYSACRLTVTHHFADSGLECKPIEGTGFLVEFPSPDTRIGLVTRAPALLVSGLLSWGFGV